MKKLIYYKVHKLTTDYLVNLEKVSLIKINRDNEDGRYEVTLTLDDGDILDCSLSENGLNELLLKIGEIEIIKDR